MAGSWSTATPPSTWRATGNRVNIDTGAGYGKPLMPVVIEGRDVFLLSEEGRVFLPPDPAARPA